MKGKCLSTTIYPPNIYHTGAFPIGQGAPSKGTEDSVNIALLLQ